MIHPIINPEDTSAAAQAAALFFVSEPDDEDVERVYSMTFRFPVSLAATIAVMAEHTHQSRNEMAQLIMRAGIDSITRLLPEEMRQDIYESVPEQISSFI